MNTVAVPVTTARGGRGMMDRETLIEATYGEADVAEFALTPDRRTPAAATDPLDRAVTAGGVIFTVFLWMAALLLAAGWLANLFLAALPWSLGLYLLAVAAAAAVAIGRRNWRAARPSGGTR